MRRGFINTLLLLLLLANPAIGAETLTPITEKLYYEASFAGLNFGKIGIEIDEQKDKASITCDIVSSGVLAWFIKHSSHTSMIATGENFTYPNKIYESHYRTRQKKRSVKLLYKDGKIIEKNIQPPENADKRPAIPDEDINSAYDLMSFLLQMRTEIINGQQNGKKDFIINAYDGRRLTQASFTISGEKIIKIAGKKHRTIAVIAKRKQLAGFSKGEIKDFNHNEPNMTIYFSNDKKLLPLRMEVPFFMQKITADLVKTCSKEESCLLGISEKINN
jgi:hypothetical protein